MKERPILFTGEMVRAILDGRKTQTRRPVKPQPVYVPNGNVSWHSRSGEGFTNMPADAMVEMELGPFGTVGDRLWVRETWRMDAHNIGAEYRASTSALMEYVAPWKPSIHMPRWASRITLEITAVRVERVQDITEEDAMAEGIKSVEVRDFYGWKNYQFKTARPRHGSVITDEEHRIHAYSSPVRSFQSLWQSIYGTRPSLPKNERSKRYERVKRWIDRNPAMDWDANPCVWVYEFRRIKP